jgi:phosphoribosyl-AMP cyclohydrolase
MIEKTLSTFHPGNIVLQQQYRNSKYQKYSELSEVLFVDEQQNEVLMSNHSARPTGSIVVPEAHATVAERSRNRKWGWGKGKWKGKRGALFKGKGKRKPNGRSEPEKKEVIIVGKSKANVIDAEQGDIGPADATPPNTSLTSTNRARISGKVNMSPTSSLSLKLRSIMT